MYLVTNEKLDVSLLENLYNNHTIINKTIVRMMTIIMTIITTLMMSIIITKEALLLPLLPILFIYI